MEVWDCAESAADCWDAHDDQCCLLVAEAAMHDGDPSPLSCFVPRSRVHAVTTSNQSINLIFNVALFFLVSLSCTYLYPLNPARCSGQRCKLSQRVRTPDVFLRILRWNQRTFCHLRNDTFVIFTVYFACVLWGRLGSIAPIRFWP